MPLLTVDLVFCLCSVVAIMTLTDRIFSPEQWLIGLKIVLPPQQVTTTANNNASEQSSTIERTKKETKKYVPQSTNIDHQC